MTFSTTQNTKATKDSIISFHTLTRLHNCVYGFIRVERKERSSYTMEFTTEFQNEEDAKEFIIKNQSKKFGKNKEKDFLIKVYTEKVNEHKNSKKVCMKFSLENPQEFI